MEKEKLVNFYLEKITLDEFNLYAARQEMTKNGVPEKEIKTIIRILDNETQRREILQHQQKATRNIIIIGGILTIIGAAITIGTYSGVIPMGDNSFLLAYGPFLGGLSILFSGLAKRRKY